PSRAARGVGSRGGLEAAVSVHWGAGSIGTATPRKRPRDVPGPGDRRRPHHPPSLASRAGKRGLVDQPRISRLAVAGAGTPLSQEDALSLLGLEGDEFAERVFGRSAVATRSLGLSTATLERTLQGRTARTEDQLFARAVEAVAQLEIDPSEIGTLVTASLYSLGGPTLAHRLLEGFAMDPAT